MKKTTTIFIFLLLTSTITWAKDFSGNAFNYDENQIQQEFGNLNNLEKFISQHPDLNYDQLKAKHPEILQNIDFDTNASPLQTGEAPLGISSFLWGCCLGIWGLLIVYIATNQDRDETRKALMGCLVSCGVAVAVWLVLIITGTTVVSGYNLRWWN